MRKVVFTTVPFLRRLASPGWNAVTGPCGGTTVPYTVVIGVTTCTTAKDDSWKVNDGGGRVRPLFFIFQIHFGYRLYKYRNVFLKNAYCNFTGQALAQQRLWYDKRLTGINFFFFFITQKSRVLWYLFCRELYKNRQ